MIERSAFYARLPICQSCEFWVGVCAKGHVLQGSLGCPVHKFPGVDAAGYMEDRPVVKVETVACCDGPDADLVPLTWMEVAAHLMESIRKWRQSGCVLTPPEPYRVRVNICQNCPKGQYKWFQCRHCRCIVFTKAKLASEDCPFGLWPKP